MVKKARTLEDRVATLEEVYAADLKDRAGAGEKIGEEEWQAHVEDVLDMILSRIEVTEARMVKICGFDVPRPSRNEKSMAAMKLRCKAGAFLSREMLGGWRPISSAPINGDQVLGYDDHQGLFSVTAFDDKDEMGWRHECPGTGLPGLVWDPTHWMPLPSAPVERPEPPGGE